MTWSRIALTAILLVIAACGDDGEDRPAAQPSPDVTSFQEGDFAGIPLPPLADEAGEQSERDGVVVRSFFVRNRDPEEVLSFYDAHFAAEDIPEVTSPRAVGDAWRGTWLVDGRELLVSATPAPTAGDDDVEHADVVTQLSLELSPAEGGGHEGRTTDP